MIVLDKKLAERLRKTPVSADPLMRNFRYTWRSNAGPVPVIPAEIKALFTKDSEVAFPASAHMVP